MLSFLPNDNLDRSRKPAKVDETDWEISEEVAFFEILWFSICEGIIQLVR